MTRQESTYYPDTFEMKEYREYVDDVLIICEKFEKNGFCYYKENINSITEYIRPKPLKKNQFVYYKEEDGTVHPNVDGRLMKHDIVSDKDDESFILYELIDLAFPRSSVIPLVSYSGMSYTSKSKNLKIEYQYKYIRKTNEPSC